ncbi:type VI secretion system tube protein Hcp [Paucibacter sp. B2R-40]|nr:type VI secretion system tube protein Hcp [Paucibacter sp. B2R-40]MCV2356006.1 type VI secretion system tube protein Hcp [Paucibacter sp. B2R-40]
MTQNGREGKIMVIAASHEIISPRDTASGLPTGKCMQKPFVSTKELDKSSPFSTTSSPIMRILRNGSFSSGRWALPVPRSSTTTIKLTKANIASIDFHMPNKKHPDLMKLNEYEEVDFTYQKNRIDVG